MTRKWYTVKFEFEKVVTMDIPDNLRNNNPDTNERLLDAIVNKAVGGVVDNVYNYVSCENVTKVEEMD